MAAPIRFLSGRNQQQKIGIEGSTENQKVLEVVGRVGIGTTIFEPTSELDVRGTLIASSIEVSTGQVNFSQLNVSGVSTFTGAIDANGDLDVDGRTELDITNINETLNVSGVSTFGSAIDINGSLDVSGVSTFGSAIDINGSLDVSGVSTFGSSVDINRLDVQNELNVIGVSTFGSSVDINGSLNAQNELNVIGVSSFGDNVSFATNIDVDGHTELDNVNVSGVTTTGGLLDINSGGQANTFKVEDLTDNRVVIVGTGGELEDDANLTFNGTQLAIGVDLDVDGHTELDNVNVSGVTTTGGLLDINSGGQANTFKVEDLTDNRVVIVGTGGELEDSPNLTFDGSTFNITGHTELDNVNVSGAITATTFTGNLAGTVNTAAQPNITSVGTLTGLDVNGHSELDNVNVSGIITTASLNATGKLTTTGIGISIANGAGNTAYIEGPSEIWIDPHPFGVGQTSGSVRIRGDLYVDGTEFIVDVDKIELGDFNIGIASTVSTNSLLDGAGLGIGATSIRKFITWNNATSALMSSENWNLASGKHYEIDGTDVLTSNTLGSGVINSSLTSVGTLGALTVSGTTFSNQLNVSGIATATTFSGNLPTTDLTGTITNAQLAGSIENSKLVNDSVSFGGVSLDLGQSDATPAFNLSDATAYPTSSLVGTITNAQLAGSIENSKLVNDSVSFGGVSLDLGQSDATPAFNLSDATNYPYTSLTGISTSIVGDTTPQLGGNLDLNGKFITGTGGINVSGVVTATTFDGNVTGTASNASGATGDFSIADKIIHTGDTNTAIRFPADDTFTVETAGSERLRITSAGLVGIGTTNPTSKIHVVGDGRFTGVVTATTFSGALSGNATSATNVTVADESSDTTCFPVFTTAATGNQAPKTGTNLTFNSSNGTLTATTFSGNLPTTDLTGTITNAQLAGSIENSKLVNDSVSFGGVSLDLGQSDATPAFNLSDATAYPTSSLVGTITNAQLAGSIENSKLVNDSVSFGGVSLDLGQSDATPAFNLSDATAYPTSSLVGTITNAQLAGSIENSKLVNDSVSFGGVSLDLGQSDATPAFNLSDATNYPYTSLTGISTSIVGDTTPQLGGNLDINGKFITGTGGINVTGVITATTFSGNLTGNAGTATSLSSARNFSISGDVVASTVSFDGTDNVVLAATIQPNSVALGSDTTGDYVGSISGTGNQITVTSGTGEGSTPVISIPNNPTLPGTTVTVETDLQVNRNLSVNGNITIGGTSATLFTETLKISDPDIVVGFRTDAGGNEISNDTTASHGGIAVASTEGSPLISLIGVGETLPATYKKIMWFESGAFTGLATDAWLTNYAFGVGTTSMSAGTKFAVGNIETDFDDITSVRHINSSGVVTATTFSGNLPTTDLTGTITNAQLAGSIANAKLANDSVSFGGVSVDLGASDATPAFNLSDATDYPTSSLVGTITNDQLAGSIANAKLANSSIAIGGVTLNLGDTDATPAFNLSDATNYPTSSLTGTISNAQLTGSITNDKLVNDSVSYGGIELDLGQSDATPAFDLSDATNYPYTSLTGITTSIVGDTTPQLGGNLDVNGKDITGTGNVNLTGVVTATTFSGSGASLTSIPNGALTNSSIAIGGVTLNLGDTDATPAFNLSDATDYPFTSLTGITTEIVGDTTPQLGGNLDINGKFITGTGGVNVTGVVTATSFVGNVTGNADTATSLATARIFELTGDVVASQISFDGTGNVSLAATIQPNSVALGGDTTGDYVSSISGTSNQITVSSGTGEGSTPVISIPNNPTLPGTTVTVETDLQVNRNLNVTGNVTIGGTSATLFTETLKIFDPDIVLGFRTDAGGNEISNDTTASHGGVAVASTEGSPLIDLVGVGETLPATYKKIMWFESGSFTGLSTDAWLTNYAFGVGTTSMSAGTKFAVGNIETDFDDITSVRHIDSSGIVTATTFSGNLPTTDLTGTITNAQLAGSIANSKLVNDSVSFGGVSLDLGQSDATPAFNLSDATNYPYTSLTGITTEIVGDTTPQLGGNLDFNSKFITGTGGINVSGVVTATTFVGNLTGTASNASGATGDFSIADKIVHTGDTNTAIRFPAVDTFTVETAGSERLRVNSSGNIGIGTDNPSEKLDVNGNVKAIDFNTTSDENLKDNIRTIKDPLAKVVQIRGVNFDWKETQKPSVGVIAQEVEKVLPELVTDSGTKTVNYNGLIGLLIEVVKEQQTQINSLNERLSKLE